jgi:hypothetical protein
LQPRRYLDSPRYEPGFRRHVEAAWCLGVRAMACLLEEVSASADLRLTVASYARLDHEFITACGGDRFPPALLALDGGTR